MRLLGVVLCLVSLFNQIGATCTDRGHASLFSNVLFSAWSIGSENSAICDHGACCHHADEDRQLPDEDEQAPASPIHLCSSTHAVFITPADVQLPDQMASSIVWFVFDGSANFCHQLMPTRGVVSGIHWFGQGTAPLRARLQVFQI